MGLFSSIMEKLGFGKKAEAKEPAAESPVAEAAAGVAVGTATESAGTSPEQVDVVAVCEALAAANPQKLNWKTSIVDLLKLLGIDSSLAHRKELAQELGCPSELIGGDYSQMNQWLIKAVMKKLAENGGKVPAELMN